MTTLMEQEIEQLDCRETVRRLWEYLDGELGDAERVAVDHHLDHCDKCPPHFTFERTFLAAVQSARAEAGASSTLRDRVRDILGVASSND